MIYFIAWMLLGFLGNQLLWMETHYKLLTDRVAYTKEVRKVFDRWAYMRGFLFTVCLGPVPILMFLKRARINKWDKIQIGLICFLMTYFLMTYSFLATQLQ